MDLNSDPCLVYSCVLLSSSKLHLIDSGSVTFDVVLLKERLEDTLLDDVDQIFLNQDLHVVQYNENFLGSVS